MKKKLRIAQLAPPFIPLPPVTHGGTEAIIADLTHELVRRGHDVTLFASGDSKTTARLRSVYDKAVSYEDLEKFVSPLARKLHWMDTLPVLHHAVQPFEESEKFDIIHDHTHYLGLFFSRLVSTPVVSTYHGALELASESKIESMLLEKYKDNNWVAISENQKNMSPFQLNFVDTIHHGIKVNEFSFSEKQGEYLVWLGRITPRKGVKEAIQVAKATGEKLVLAGVVKERDRDYFEKEIQPEIDGKQIQYIGPVNHEQKVDVLRNAKALLYPLQWDEPFGIVMVESLACGTPVLALNRGAAAEIVENNVTGFVVETQQELIEAVKKIHTLNRVACRERVEKHFSVSTMTDKYEALFYELLSKK